MLVISVFIVIVGIRFFGIVIWVFFVVVFCVFIMIEVFFCRRVYIDNKVVMILEEFVCGYIYRSCVGACVGVRVYVMVYVYKDVWVY